MRRGGQVTVFIVIGLLVFFVLGVIVWKVNSTKRGILVEDAKLDTSKVGPVENYVNMCLKSVGTEAVLLLGRQGRIYPRTFILSGKSEVAYFYYNGTGMFPYDISFLEEDVSRYVKENLHTCLDWSAFDYEFEANDQEMRVRSSFNELDAVIQMDYPITIKMGAAQKTITEFSSRLDIRFMGLYDASRKIYQKTEGDPEWIDADYLAQIPYEVKLVKINDDTLMYEITDPIGLAAKPYTYRFAIKYGI